MVLSGFLWVKKYDVFGNRLEKAVDPDGIDANPTEITRFAIDGWNPSKLPSPFGRGVGGEGPVGNENFDVLADLAGDSSLATRYLRGDTVDQLLGRIDVTRTTGRQAAIVLHGGLSLLTLSGFFPTLVHPDLKEVIPLAPEPIINQDGHTQNTENASCRPVSPTSESRHENAPCRNNSKHR